MNKSKQKLKGSRDWKKRIKNYVKKIILVWKKINFIFSKINRNVVIISNGIRKINCLILE